MTYLPHTFCFAELRTPDVDAAARFYGGLFGWSLQRVGDAYWMFRLGARDVAGLRLGPEPRWLAALKVDGVEAAAARLVQHGATVEGPPVLVEGIARTCVVRDREGAAVQLWEPRGIDGTAVESGPGSLWWIELATADMDAAAAFYTSVFDWGTTHTMKYENGPKGYTLFTVNGRATAGAFETEPEWGIAPAWQVYVQVADFSASVALACRSGGSDGFWRDAPNAGRIGVLNDPAGALFLIAQPLAAGGGS